MVFEEEGVLVSVCGRLLPMRQNQGAVWMHAPTKYTAAEALFGRAEATWFSLIL